MSVKEDSCSALASKLNQFLPLHVSSQTVQEMPKLGQLLEDITQHLTPSAVLTRTQQELNNASVALKQARICYMGPAALLHYTLVAVRDPNSPKELQHMEDIIAMSHLAVSLQLSPSPGNKPANKAVSSKKAATGHKLCINENSSSESSFLGSSSSNSTGASSTNNVTLSYVSPTLGSRAARLSEGSVATALARTVSHRLVHAWQTLLPCITPLSAECCEPVLHMTRLADGIKSSGRAFTACTARLHALLRRVEDQQVEYGERLSQLVQQRRLSQQPLHHLMYLSTALYAQYHKLRCVELQILCSTYNSEAVNCIKSLIRQLSELITEEDLKLTGLQHKMNTYKVLGPSYLALLDEYNKLRADVEFCRGSSTS